jgi:hypothetical protein
MTTLLMSSVVDGSIVALGIMITVALWIFGLATSNPHSVAKAKNLRKPMKRIVRDTYPL